MFNLFLTSIQHPQCFFLRLTLTCMFELVFLTVLLPVKMGTSNFVSIFDLRRKRFLCMDREGELYNSRHKDREECLFQHIWLDFDSGHDVFYSTSGGQLFRLKAAELRVSHQEPPEPPSSLLQRFLGASGKRQKRSEEVNPSDPLQTESHPSLPTKDHKDADQRQPEQDQTGAVSKETITSCDDPLRVLQTDGLVSPVKTNIAERAEQD
ncbi:fibroblast growth factor 23-like [Xyrichtys novacula]|uniref:Fibroblast growth factor 23-like n=1 Tax=Xyrichtys novacula TaxID=13765 RepID=A0AAV1F854_XYRNO|nr:fibroblast growth factor 23-like [Xyrichtys novacula]